MLHWSGDQMVQPTKQPAIWDKYILRFETNTVCNLDKYIEVVTGTKQAAGRSDNPFVQSKNPLRHQFGFDVVCLLEQTYFWE